MRTRTHLAGIVAALLVTAGGSQMARAEPLRIRYSIWVGYGPSSWPPTRASSPKRASTSS